MKNTQIRPSQFITTYGVGALVDGPDGSCVILDFRLSELFGSSGDPPYQQFIIAPLGASRLIRRLGPLGNVDLDKIGIFKLPSNAELGRNETEAIYRIRAFPNWSLCNKHKKFQILYQRHLNDGRCPICTEEAQKKGQVIPTYESNKEVIRFIRICPSGHMSDVWWNKEVHEKGKLLHNPDYFYWIDEGSELKYVKITCPICNSSTTLQKIMDTNTPCSGEHPHLSLDSRTRYQEDCLQRNKENTRTTVIQRNASSVFVPEIITTISHPKEANAFYKVLLFPPFLPILRRDYRVHNIIMDFKTVYKEFEEFVQSGEVGANYLFEILKTIELKFPDEIKLANEIIEYFTKEIIGKSNKKSLGEIDLRKEEFITFKEKQGSLSIDPTLVIDRKNTKSFLYKNHKFKVTPVPRLEVIMVQAGFKRICRFKNEDLPIYLVPTPYRDRDENNWYVGAKLNGEGIFIELDDDEKLRIEDKEKIWETMKSGIEILERGKEEDDNSTINNAKKIPGIEKKWCEKFKFRKMDDFCHPLGIWWHTLSHRLIKAIAFDCGYSSASIRERIYLDLDKNEGGLLLYACRAGEDGTFGGLVSQVPHFDTILESALKEIDSCSNDPICSANEFKIGKINGAACYACLFLSETSCEFGNIGLDRNILIKML